MWFFVDESWGPDNITPAYGVLSAVLMESSGLPTLERFLFQVRKKYYGKDHARDYKKDIKGKELLSNQMVKLWNTIKTMPNNISLAKELLMFSAHNEDVYFKTFASVVYSSNARHPDLLSPDPKRLSTPFRVLIENASKAAHERDPNAVVKLVFDQRLGSQEGLAIAMKHFIAGIGLANIHPYPYFAVSNVCPGVQCADVFAYIISKKVQQVGELESFYRLWRTLQWQSPEGERPQKFGLNRWDEKNTHGVRSYTVRRGW